MRGLEKFANTSEYETVVFGTIRKEPDSRFFSLAPCIEAAKVPTRYVLSAPAASLLQASHRSGVDSSHYALRARNLELGAI